jgi:hypothetical protein
LAVLLLLLILHAAQLEQQRYHHLYIIRHMRPLSNVKASPINQQLATLGCLFKPEQAARPGDC